MKYLLDMNIMSEPLRPIPALVWHELRFGRSRLTTTRRRKVIEWLHQGRSADELPGYWNMSGGGG